MHGQWMGVLVGAGLMLFVACIVAAGYFFYGQTPKHAVASEAAAVSPSTVQSMTLEAQFKGPLQDTVIQRWRDPDTDMICYVYLPVVVQHSPPTPTGFVQYGANGIGSISCIRNP
ncbi:MAG TPA: hypothetical protein VG867_05620 [Rhizomicrobium sp.]|nr:hypothetical protein [Rhizomicrobium sp.]